MPGPDLRINTRPLSASPFGVPVVASGAPVVTPSMPNVSPGAPTRFASQQAAAVDYNALRGFASPNKPCKGCGPEGPSLRDIAPPGFLANVPMWAKIVGALAGLGLVVGVITYFVRR